MEIQITQEESWASNSLSATAQNAQAELNRAIAANKAYIALLETKYDATFNATTRQLEPKPKEEEELNGKE